MKTLAQFYPFVEPEVMGCPYPVMDHHLRLALREFCQKSKAWREWADSFIADGSVNTFQYDLAAGQEIVCVPRALRGNDPLEVMSEDQLPDDWQDATPQDLNDAIVHFDEASFMVFPNPASGDVIRLEMVFQPTVDATSVGDILYDKWADHIAAGCKARLMAMLGQPWANAALAAKYEADFTRSISRAANTAAAMRGQLRAKPSPNGSSQ